MIKVTGPALSLDAKGTLADTLTFQKRPSGHSVYLRSHPGGREPYIPPPAVLAQRTVIANLVYAWRHLDVNYREQWDEMAKEMGEVGTGYHLYIKYGGIFPEMVPAVLYDPTDDSINCGKLTGYDPASAFTFECFAMVGSNSKDRTLLAKLSWTNPFMLGILGIRSINGSFEVRVGNTIAQGSTVTDVGMFLATIPYHIAFSFSGGTVKIYRNGVVIKQGIGQTYAPATNNYFYLGWPDHNYWEGMLTEVRYWNVALNDADVFIHSKKIRDISTVNSPGVNSSNLRGHWPMLEGSGATTADTTGNKNTGVFKAAGEPAWVTRRLFKDIYGLT